MTFVRAAFILCVLLLLNGCGAPSSSSGSVPASAPPIITTKTGVEMVLIPAGTFEMGSKTHPGETPHMVSLDSFYIDRTEVTQEQFARLSIPDPSHFKDNPKNPAEQITLLLVKRYCNERSAAEGLTPCYTEDDEFTCKFAENGYRLPTEAEWEYACRAGSDKDYSYGADPRKLSEVAWYKDNAASKTHPVAQKKPNAWGLFDMHGNVAEWCNDYYDPNYYAMSPASNPQGPAGKANLKLVLRGGGWDSSADQLRSSNRAGENPGFQDACFKLDAIGFRCVRTADKEKGRQGDKE